MLALQFVPLVVKQVVRHPTRSALTVGGVAIAMFLFCGVQALQDGVEAVTQGQAKDTELVVYRRDRYCPFTSQMPQAYAERIGRIAGVTDVVPLLVAVSNCRVSLDVVTFCGVPAERFLETHARDFAIVAGSAAEWERRSDAALVGERLAGRRRLRVGDRFGAAGVNVYVAGIFRSQAPEHWNVAYTHLEFLQRAAARGGLGVVTQFNVRVADGKQLERVAAAIDAEFASDSDPTRTWTAQAFFARAAKDVLEIVGLIRWLGWGCLAAVLGLVANAIMLAVRERTRDHAVLQALGFRGRLIAGMVVAEGVVLSLGGSVVGLAAAAGIAWWGRFSLSVAGQAVPIAAGPSAVALGLIVSVLLGVLAGLVPAWQESRREIVECFRAE